MIDPSSSDDDDESGDRNLRTQQCSGRTMECPAAGTRGRSVGARVNHHKDHLENSSNRKLADKGRPHSMQPSRHYKRQRQRHHQDSPDVEMGLVEKEALTAEDVATWSA